MVEVGTGSIWGWKTLKSGRVTASHSLEGGEKQERQFAPVPRDSESSPEAECPGLKALPYD